MALVKDPSALTKIKAFMDSEASVSIILLVKTYDNILKTELNGVCDTLDCHHVWLEIDSKHRVFSNRPPVVRTHSSSAGAAATTAKPKRTREQYNQYEGLERNRYRNRHLQRPSLASSSSSWGSRGVVFAIAATALTLFNVGGGP